MSTRYTRYRDAAWCPDCRQCPAAENPGIGCECPCHTSGQLGGKDDVRHMQGPRLDTSPPEYSASAFYRDGEWWQAVASIVWILAWVGLAVYCFVIWIPTLVVGCMFAALALPAAMPVMYK